jgi:hypothetical protein
MTPTLSKAGSWPVEGSERQNHRIRFYARFGIQLKLSSQLSFIEQVVQCEHCIASGQRKVMTVGDYSSYVSQLQAKMSIPGFSLLNSKAHKMPKEKTTSMRVLMKETTDGKLRVAHSCNLFDLMAHFHCQNQGNPGHGYKDLDVIFLREELYISMENALRSCPLFSPSLRH